MKSKRESILAAIALLLLAGCSKDNERSGGEPTDARVALQVSGGIQTRAYDNTWEANDAIGIYMVTPGELTISEGAENRCYTTPDGSRAFGTPKETTIYFPVGGSPVDFFAYYPYQATLTNGEITFSVGSQSNLSAIDLMTAQVKSTADAPVNKNNPQVALAFAHILTKLELKIAPGIGISKDDLKNLKVEITNQRTEGSYDLLFEAHGVDTEPVQPIVLNTNAEGTLAQAILLPNSVTLNPVIEGREFIFSLAASGEVFRWSIPNEKLFKRGDKNIYNIIINRTKPDVTATITDWNKGNEEGDDASAE